MLTLYSFPTPNGRKASILLEELGLPYTVHRVDLAAGENRRPDFLAVSPITKIPALVEELPGGRVRRLFGSGAILLHYAERTGRLLPEDEDDRAEAMSWFMLGISDLGPTAIDMQRFARRYGVPLKMNPHFPINTLLLMRAATGVQLRQPERFEALLACVFKGMWVDALNLGDAAVLGPLLAEAGFDPQALLALAAEQEVKDALKANTEAAIKRGMFGAPTMFVGDEMFFGQDRLDFIREALA